MTTNRILFVFVVVLFVFSYIHTIKQANRIDALSSLVTVVDTDIEILRKQMDPIPAKLQEVSDVNRRYRMTRTELEKLREMLDTLDKREQRHWLTANGWAKE